MGILDLFRGNPLKNIQEVAWERSPEGSYYRLHKLDTDHIEQAPAPAVFIIWHGGTKPGWVYVGVSHDLSDDLSDLQQNKALAAYHAQGGLLVTWSLFPESQIAGIMAFLNDVLMPEVLNPDTDLYRDADPVCLLPPGYDKETFLHAFAEK